MEVSYMNYREVLFTLYSEKPIRYKAGDDYGAYLVLSVEQSDGSLSL